MSRRILLGFASLMLATWLSACSSVPTVDKSSPNEGPQYNGRLALKVAPDGPRPAQSLSAQFELAGTEQRGHLTLFTPLGTVLAHATWTPERVQLLSSEGTRSFASLSALSAEALGEPLPLAALLYWMGGKPWPGALALANDGGFSQLGWQVDLAALNTQGLLEARRDAAPAVQLRARLEH